MQAADALFELLFKYPRIAYQRGEIVWGASWPTGILLLAAAVAAGTVAWSYWRRTRDATSPGATWVLGGVRVAGVGLLLVVLLRPTLVLSTAVPRENVVAVLIDDSRSMGIADVGDRSRGEVVRGRFATPESDLLAELEDRFVVRHFRFSAGAERLRSSEELTFEGSRTRIGPALEFVRRELQSVPLSGIVLVTDGGDHDPESLEDAILGLRAEGLPVHVVAAGRDRLDPDVEVERLEMPRTVLRGSTVVADVVVAHAGLGGRRVPVLVEEEGRILASQEVELPRGAGSVTVRIPFRLDDAGVRHLSVRVPVQGGEVVEENNQRDTQVRVREGREKILYYEGEPRFEVGFLRRAVRDDENLQVVVLQRTGEERFLRLDVDDGEELVGGFPRTREELFRYRGLVLGSVEASSFTQDQLRMIADFVDRRGGGLLVLGGRRSLAEGGYAGTALAPVLPVDLGSDVSSAQGNNHLVHLRVSPTRSGSLHPVLRMENGAGTQGPNDPAPGATVEWDRLPPLSSVNRVGAPRPGATVLLTGENADSQGPEQPVLAFQRYGAGVSAALAVQDTWLWQMHADIPLEDRTHETLWRQLLRWLIQDVPEPLHATVARDRVAPEEPVEIVARVSSAEHLPVNDARVVARIVDPFGGEREVRLDWSLERDGEYRGSYTPIAAGPHEIHVSAEEGTRALDAPPVLVEAGVLDEELRGGAMRDGLLRRIAAETGGEFRTLERTDGLAEALRYTERGTVVQEERDLWDLPAFFLLLVGLLSAEWLLRRRRGLA